MTIATVAVSKTRCLGYFDPIGLFIEQDLTISCDDGCDRSGAVSGVSARELPAPRLRFWRREFLGSQDYYSIFLLVLGSGLTDVI